MNVEVIEVPTQFVLGIRETGKYQEKIPDMMKRIFTHIGEKGIQCTGAPVFVCHETPEEVEKVMEEGTADIEVCVPVAEKGEDIGEFKYYELPGGSMAKTIHKGPYEDCGPAYENLFKWIAENGKSITGPTREVYLNDPNEVDAEEILTEIYAPVK